MGIAWRLVDGEDENAAQGRRGRVVAWRCRLKREDCRRTKYEAAFSKWEILVGPDDWENYSLGKDGAERYRTRNLARSCSCPGIYELGLARLSANSSRRLDLKDILIVYLGQAENVRTRLQHYGRTGSHLEQGDSTLPPGNSADIVHQRRRGLFKQVFSMGFSIVFRWSLMKSKREAIDAEAHLLEAFDYAWNRISNAACRHEDILLKLDKLSRAPSPLHSFLVKLKPCNWKFSARKSPDNSLPVESDSELSDSCPLSIQQKNRPTSGRGSKSICGATTDDGSVCGRSPIPGRKRCGEHKGKRSSMSLINGEKKANKELEYSSTVCGVFLDDGSICSNHPPMARKRCYLHKGRRIGRASTHFHDRHEEELASSVSVMYRAGR